jgi:hypothetical protein
MQHFARKLQMFDSIKDLETAPQLFIYYLHDGQHHQFTYFDTHQLLLQNINDFKIDGNYYINEMVTEDTGRKPYLDIECIYENEDTYNDKYEPFVRKLQADLIKIFKNQYNEDINQEDILILNSSGDSANGYKLSLHVIIAPIDRVLCYTNVKNEVEQLNKHSDTFITVLNSLIQRGGHQLNFNIVDKPRRKKKDEIPSIIDKLVAIDESEYDLEELRQKQANSKADPTEKLVLKKVFFQFIFGINNSKNKDEMKKFLEAYYGKEFLIKHYSQLFGYKTKKERDIDNHIDGKDTVKKEIIIDLLNRLTGKEQQSYKPDQLVDILRSGFTKKSGLFFSSSAK